MGQGIQTTLPAVLADELGADWSRVRLENAPADPAYRNPRINWQFTGNSESTTAFFDLMREMGAAGRQMLIGAAARQWSVDPGTCHAERSRVIHTTSRRSLTFGELAEAATAMPHPEAPSLKPPSDVDHDWQVAPTRRKLWKGRWLRHLWDGCHGPGDGVRGSEDQPGLRRQGHCLRSRIKPWLPRLSRSRGHPQRRCRGGSQLLAGTHRAGCASHRIRERPECVAEQRDATQSIPDRARRRFMAHTTRQRRQGCDRQGLCDGVLTGLRVAVPRTRDDGADELHGSRHIRRVRGMGADSGPGARTARRFAGPESSEGEGQDSPDSPRRRVRAAARRRLHCSGSAGVEGRRCPGQSDLVPRRGYAARHISACRRSSHHGGRR